MSIKKILRIALMIFSILPLLIVAVVGNYLISEKLQTTRYENLLQLAKTNGNSLQALVDAQKNEINLLSEQSNIKKLIEYSNLEFSQKTPAYVESKKEAVRMLRERKVLYPYCRNISLYNNMMSCIAQSNPKNTVSSKYTATTLHYLGITQNFVCGISGMIPYEKDGKTSYCIEIGSPIIPVKGGSITGYVITTLDISFFNKFLDGIKVGKTGNCMLLDSNSQVFYSTDSRKIGVKYPGNSALQMLSDYEHKKIKRSDTFMRKENNVKKAYAYSILPNINWILFISQDDSEINDLSNIIFIIILCTSILLIFIIMIISNLFTKYFTKPILSLRDSMKTASDGNFEVQCKITSKNEFGELSDSFNKMMGIIKKNYDDLNIMHKRLMDNEEELRSNYAHIEFLAYHDALTKLPNKMAFYDKVHITLSTEPGISSKHAIYFVDLDNFKTINDTLGHDYGDELLIQTAAKLSSVLTDRDILARAGGDEFLVFKTFISSEQAATSFASQILDAFREPFDLNGETVYISMSIGISIYPQNGSNHNVLIKNADIAMYKSKDTGKNKLTLFDASMETELNRSTDVLEVLRHAVQQKEIYLMYQPQIEINTGKIIGYEALVRINSSKLGLISPSEFIPIAEESGLIVEIGSWILEEACRFNKSLIDEGYPVGTVSVNISSIQLNRAEFIPLLSKILERTGLPPQYLELEITESTLLSSIVDTATLLNTFQEMGVKVSLDDFGTGYSSLNYLTHLPINTLKIDKSFVDNICTDSKDSYIAETIIGLAHNLNIKVIAEGVENSEQYDLLKTKYCDIIQGYLLSRPLMAETLKAHLAEYIKKRDFENQ